MQKVQLESEQKNQRDKFLNPRISYKLSLQKELSKPIINTKLVSKMIKLLEKQQLCSNTLKILRNNMSKLNSRIFQNESIYLNQVVQKYQDFTQCMQEQEQQINSKDKQIHSNNYNNYNNQLLNAKIQFIKMNCYEQNKERVKLQKSQLKYFDEHQEEIDKVVKFSTIGCLGCIKNVYNGLKLSQTGQAFIQMQYNSATYEKELNKAFCSLLNHRGGYVFIDAQKFSLNPSNTKNIETDIQNIFNMNEWGNAKIKIDFLNYQKNPFFMYEQQPENKYMIRVSISSGDLKKIYCCTNQYNDSFIYLHKMKGGAQKIIKFVGHQIYSQIPRLLNIQQKQVTLCYNTDCVGIYHKRNRMIQEILLKYEGVDQEPNFRYSGSMIIIMNKSKSKQQNTARKMLQILESHQIKHLCNRPYKSYNQKNHSTIIYFVSFDSQFENIVNILQPISKEYKKMDKKFVMIELTKTIQIPLCLQSSSKQEIDKYNKALKYFNQQIAKNKLQMIHEVKYGKHPTLKKKCQSQYFTFNDLKATVFSFIILCNTGTVGYLIKQQ